MRRPSTAALLLLLAGVGAGAVACDTPAGRATRTPDDGSNGAVVRVVDGDTLVVDVEGAHGVERETVRLIGVDTPETVRPGAAVECYGPEASARMGQLLPAGTRVRIERDAEARDDYGRLLAYVRRAADGLLVNVSLVADGFATPLTFPTNTIHTAEIVAAAREAERAGLGLWSACAG